MLKRAQVGYDGRSWTVDLPSYAMRPGSWLPITPKLIDADGVLAGADTAQVIALGPTCIVALPDDTPLDNVGQIDKARLAAIYGGRWSDPAWTPPVLAEP